MPSNIFSEEYPEETENKQDNATREMAFDANFRMTRYVKQTYTQLKMAAVPIFFSLTCVWINNIPSPVENIIIK